MEKIYIHDQVMVANQEMFELIVIGDDNETIESLRKRYQGYIPDKHKPEIRKVSCSPIKKGFENLPFIKFWVNQEKKEELEDEGILHVWLMTKKW